MKGNLPDIEDTQALADWMEANLFLRRSISRAELRRHFSIQTEHDSETIDIALESLFNEIIYRNRIAAPVYPFIIDNPSIIVGTNPNLEHYKFLLLLELSPNFRKQGLQDVAEKIFDSLVIEALKKYVGDGGRVISFAWPPTGDRPSDFKEALQYLCACLHLPRGMSKDSYYKKDGGVDVVAWKSFPDDREAYWLMLIQCTIQKDWFQKSKDALPSIWLGRIDSGMQANVALAIPFKIPIDFLLWDELRHTVNVVFERFRLSKYLAAVDSTEIPNMIEWNQNEMAAFK